MLDYITSKMIQRLNPSLNNTHMIQHVETTCQCIKEVTQEPWFYNCNCQVNLKQTFEILHNEKQKKKLIRLMFPSTGLEQINQVMQMTKQE